MTAPADECLGAIINGSRKHEHYLFFCGGISSGTSGELFFCEWFRRGWLGNRGKIDGDDFLEREFLTVAIDDF